MKVTPRVYQELAAKAALKGLRGRFMRALVVLATGLGKTLAAAFIARRFRAKRVLFLVHNNFILQHAMDEFKLVFDENTKMVMYNGLSKAGAQKADIVFATWQTMGKKLKRWSRDHFDLIIVDEAHHTEADTYRPVVDYFIAPKLGITATPDRQDDRDIREVFGEWVINVSLEEAIAHGWLPRVEYHVITDKSLDEDMLQKIASEIREGKRRFTMAEVNRRIFIKKRDAEIAHIINGYDEKAIVFCSSIRHSKGMRRLLKSAETFHSKKGRTQAKTWKRNRAVLKALEKGKVRRVCAVNAFNEGVNVPSVGLVAFCRATEVLRVFLQQLGRGLRPGKEKLVALDFVGNLERIELVIEMMNRISDLHEEFVSPEEREHDGYVRRPFEVSGKGFEFTFSNRVVDLMTILEHSKREFYRTWQEAGKAAIERGLTTAKKYRRKQAYLADPKLPSNPNVYYKDYPGDSVFFGREKREFYKTCAEAQRVARGLNAKSVQEYRRLCVSDPMLPKYPDEVYEDFPGYVVYLGSRYLTWQEAGAAVKKLGIKNRREYVQRYKEDFRLPSNPARAYADYPGAEEFFGTRKYYYSTLEQASKAAIGRQIRTRDEYLVRRKEDPMLPSDPNEVYPDFISWGDFLSTGREHRSETYGRCEDASKAAISMGIVSKEDYAKKYKGDKRLPSSPASRYSSFPGWRVFLGGEDKDVYPYLEASLVAQKMGIKTWKEYVRRRKEDERLPGDPPTFYEEWKSWAHFLGKEVKNLYGTCREAGIAAKSMGIKSASDYWENRKKDPRLPRCPNEVYPDFPGWPQFLGKD